MCHGQRLHDAQRKEVVGAKDAVRKLARVARHQLVAHPAAGQDGLPLGFNDFQRRAGNFGDGAPRPLEAVGELADRRRPCHEGEPTAADVQQVPGGEVTALDVVDRHRTVLGVVGEAVH